MRRLHLKPQCTTCAGVSLSCIIAHAFASLGNSKAALAFEVVWAPRLKPRRNRGFEPIALVSGPASPAGRQIRCDVVKGRRCLLTRPARLTLAKRVGLERLENIKAQSLPVGSGEAAVSREQDSPAGRRCRIPQPNPPGRATWLVGPKPWRQGLPESSGKTDPLDSQAAPRQSAADRRPGAAGAWLDLIGAWRPFFKATVTRRPR